MAKTATKGAAKKTKAPAPKDYTKELATIDGIFNDAGPDAQKLLTHIVDRFQQRSEDNTQTQRLYAFNMKNAEWLMQGPIAFTPMYWNQLLDGHGKMTKLAFALVGRANNLGQIQRLKVEDIAKDLGFNTTQTLAYITNFVGLGMVSIQNPLDKRGRMFLNLQLHCTPIRFTFPQEQTKVIDLNEKREEKAAAAAMTAQPAEEAEAA